MGLSKAKAFELYRNEVLSASHKMARQYVGEWSRLKDFKLVRLATEAKKHDIEELWFMRLVFAWTQTLAPEGLTIVRLNEDAVGLTAKQLGSMTDWKQALPYVKRLGFSKPKDLLLVTPRPTPFRVAQEMDRVHSTGIKSGTRLLEAKEHGLIKGTVPPLLKAFVAAAGR